MSRPVKKLNIENYRAAAKQYAADFIKSITSLHKDSYYLQNTLEKEIFERTGQRRNFDKIIEAAENSELRLALSELDSYYIKSVGCLHQLDPASNVPSHLQMYLEEAIKTKTGVVKDYTSLISTVSNRPLDEIRTTTHVIEESKTTSSSDNELELDLFNEDLMCIVCNGMDVAARNRLLECSDCHSLYHQECHRPPVTSFDPDGTWTCQNCKEASKRMKKSTPGSSPSHAPPAPTPTINIKPAMKNSPPHAQQRGSSNLPSYKPSSSKSATTTSMSKSSSSSSSSKTSSKSSSAVGNGMKNSATPNIISADKRLQIMKKKAAKLHEKRKQLPR